MNPSNYLKIGKGDFSLKPKHGHKERELDVTGVHGSQFRIILRESIANPLGFSVILAYCLQRQINFSVYGGKR